MDPNTKKSPKSFIDNLAFILLSLTLFVGGIFILYLKIPFWSLFLGIASTQIGIVLMIFTYEHFTRRKNKPITEDYKALPCLICKATDYVPKYENTTICDNCKIKIANSAKSFMVVIFALFSMTSLLYFMKYNQDIRRQAKSDKSFVCEEGIWEPQYCSCGKEAEFYCLSGEIARKCSDENYYCCTMEYSEEQEVWKCTQIE